VGYATPTPLSPANLDIFFFKMPPAGSRSSYFNETNVLGKAIDSAINQNPWITLTIPDLVFHPFLETTPHAMATPRPVQNTTGRERKI
jgi:hypothetical protein